MSKKVNCLHNGLPCAESAIKGTDATCNCLTCMAWLSKHVEGFDSLDRKSEMKAIRVHLDAAYEAARVSKISSRPLSCYIQDYVKVVEHYAALEKATGIDGPASKIKRWVDPHYVDCPLCNADDHVIAMNDFEQGKCPACKGKGTIENDGSHV